ncbi:MAG: DUF6263 family protein [Ferruginibacter sp.]
MKHYYLFFAAICIFTINTSAQTSSGKILLTKGQKIQIDNNVKTVSSQEMAGQAIEITVNADMTHQLEVKARKKNSYVLSSTLTKLATNGSAMGQEMKFDSEKKEDLESETGKALKDQLNVTKELELDENSKVINGVKKDTATTPGSGQLMDIMNNITGGGGDESNGASAAFDVIPAGKKAGDSWSDSSVTEEMKIYRNYTIKAINGSDATVTLTGKQITKKKIEMQGMEINVSMEGTLSGEGVVDIKTGLVKQKTTVLDGISSTEVMGQSIPGTTKITTTTTVKTI